MGGKAEAQWCVIAQGHTAGQMQQIWQFRQGAEEEWAGVPARTKPYWVLA